MESSTEDNFDLLIAQLEKSPEAKVLVEKYKAASPEERSQVLDSYLLGLSPDNTEEATNGHEKDKLD